MKFKILLIVLLLLFALQTFIAAQGPAVTTPSSPAREPPSVLTGGNFISLQGRFTVALPQQNNGFHELALPTPFGQAKGDAYRWQMKEASFVVGYANAEQPIESPEIAEKVFDALREDFRKIAVSNNGRVWKEKQIELGGHRGIEQRLDMFSGFMIQRTYLVSNRLYQILMVIRTTLRDYEGVAAKVLDSFRLLTESEVSAKLAEEIARAEPDPLPQQPVAARVSTDARDNGLRDRVKSVLEESQDLSGTWLIQTRKRESFETYNEQGNLTRRESYDNKGSLFFIAAFGYIDGYRVSKGRPVRRENDPPLRIVSTPSVAGAKQSDPPYQIRYESKYDDQKRLIESNWFRSNGDRFRRLVYHYTENQLEGLVYSEDGSLNQRYISKIDKQGDEIERTVYDPRDGAPGKTYAYTYEFDSRGNWTKRTTSNLVTKDGKSEREPLSVRFRQITYF